MQNNSRLIIVLGVRRSGTSAMVKGLETMGVSIVDQAEAPFNAFNKKGYWEDLHFHSLNIELTKALIPLEGRYRSTLPLSKEETDFLCEEGFLEKGMQLILSKISRLQQPLGIKDPRFSILLPFWKRVFKASGLSVSYLIALRDPISTIASMKAFGKFREENNDHDEKFFWTWVTFLLGSLNGSEGEERILVDYGELLKDPAFQMKRIASFLKLEIQEDRLQDYCANFIDSSMCHFKVDFSAAEFSRNAFPQYQGFVLEMYQQLFAVAKDEISFLQLQHVLSKWNERLSIADSLLMLAEKNEHLINRQRATIIAQIKKDAKLKN